MIAVEQKIYDQITNLFDLDDEIKLLSAPSDFELDILFTKKKPILM